MEKYQLPVTDKAPIDITHVYTHTINVFDVNIQLYSCYCQGMDYAQY